MRSPFVLAALALSVATPAAAVTINYTDFASTAGLQLNGDAAAAVDDASRNVLRVTPGLDGQSGSAFSTSAIQLGAGASFSTKFRFNFNHQGGIEGADGLVFAVQTNANNVGGGGGGIGFEGIPKSVGIEFDTFDNGNPVPDGGDGNHVGIDLNGDLNSVARTPAPFNLESGTDLFAWIDYNGVTGDLEVRLNDADSRPGGALLSLNVDLAAVLGSTSAFVGFTSGTGSGFENHDIVSWEFRDDFAPVDVVPEPATLLLLGGGLAGLGLLRRRRRA